MRLIPGIALMLERYVPEGGSQLLDGRLLTDGTRTGINPAVTNRNTNVFSPETYSFVPECWLRCEDETEVEFVARSKRMNDVFDFTFGAERRVGIGRNMARIEVYKILANLYTLFDVSL